MKKILITILGIFGICFSFCSADTVFTFDYVYKSSFNVSAGNIFPDGYMFFSYGMLYGPQYSSNIFLDNSETYYSNTPSDFWTLTLQNTDGVPATITIFDSCSNNNGYYICSDGQYSIDYITSPKFKVNYGNTSYEYDLDSDLSIYLKSPVTQNGNTFTYDGQTGLNLFYNGSSQFYSKDKLYLNSMYRYNNNIFTPICS